MKISEEQLDIKKRHDRIGKYLKNHVIDFVFDEFSEGFMKKTETFELMRGVPIPLRKCDVEQTHGEGIKTLQIAENMAWVMGVDPKFKFTEHYIAFLSKLYGYKSFEGLAEDGVVAAGEKDFERACILFRACLCLKPDYLQGMYGYAKVCRDMYLQGGDTDFVGNFKAEAIDFFELTAEEHPEFPETYYFLGYAYLNLGLYTKADITWRQFINRSDNEAEKTEIVERLVQIETPLKIENGCNDVMAGRYADGIFKLEPYKEGKFETWWPLFYYLGIAHFEQGESAAAEENFKNVLKLNPSNIEAMLQLTSLYEVAGDEKNAQKYAHKAELIKSQMEDGGTNEN